MRLTSFIKADNTLTTAEKKQREVFMYLLFGGLTTIVNLITYYLLGIAFSDHSIIVNLFSYPVDIMMLINQTIAWVVAVMFAFLTNRAWVFCSKGPFFREMFAFFSARIVTLILFELLMFAFMIFILENGFNISKNNIFLSVAGLDFKWEFFVKILNSVFVVVSNYFFSKWFIFTKKASVQATDNDGDSDNDDE